MRQENAEFIALYKLSGWNQTEAAKRFHCSQAVISRWLNDVDPADKKAVDLFKFILASEQPDKLSPLAFKEHAFEEWENEILNDLRGLHVEDRERVLNAVKAFVNGLPKRPAVTYRKKVSSKIAAAADSIEEELAENILAKRKASTAKPSP